MWCYDNVEKPRTSNTFSKYIREHAEELNVEGNKNVPISMSKTARGFNGIKPIKDDYSGFLKMVGESPF
jgi:hypothetical protein